MSEPSVDQVLLKRLLDGDERAATEIFDLYADRLVRLAGRRISQRLASRIGAEDIVQSVFRTFFQRAKQGEFELQEHDEMCRLLARITLRKTFRQITHHHRAKRSVRREVAGDEASHEALMTLLTCEPSPDETAALIDQMEALLAQLRPDDRRIVEMKMQGAGTQEIAEKLGVSDRKVRRLMERLRSLAAQAPVADETEVKDEA